ncbi:hypothetical protein PR048_029064 [Dryococelus australis]|uniref:Integrase catalytic domain-containing protein n=1 Tax=Dryococelus australis TaxID=614101 RepID=A0ABQ9GCC7_9NEOP|nr:hypothetical protein PR048_029064 [Dryococelus australis]
MGVIKGIRLFVSANKAVSFSYIGEVDQPLKLGLLYITVYRNLLDSCESWQTTLHHTCRHRNPHASWIDLEQAPFHASSWAVKYVFADLIAIVTAWCLLGSLKLTILTVKASFPRSRSLNRAKIVSDGVQWRNQTFPKGLDEGVTLTEVKWIEFTLASGAEAHPCLRFSDKTSIFPKQHDDFGKTSLRRLIKEWGTSQGRSPKPAWDLARREILAETVGTYTRSRTIHLSVRRIWKFQIVVLLKTVDLYNVVSTEFRECEQDTNWGKKDAKAQRYIVTTMDKANELADWCRERGIKIYYAPAASPQLNGRAERLNRMLMEKTRALLFDSCLEKELWGEALRTATYLLNRSPFATVDTTPAELCYGKRLDLSNLKLFRSLAYANKLKMLGKLDKRYDKLIMVGYATNGYRLWISEKREVKLSRDVTFVGSTEVSARNNSSQEIIADTVSLVDSEETLLRLADNMEVRRNTTVLQDDVVDEPFHVFRSDQDTAKTSEMLDSLPKTATEIENCNHQGRKERIKRKPQYL